MARAFILSHGARVPGAGETFVPEGKSIAFYSEYDENTLRSIGLAAVNAGDIEPAEPPFKGGDPITNYRLSQFEDSAMAEHLASESSLTGGKLYFVGSELPSPVYLCTTPGACAATRPKHAPGCQGAFAKIAEDEILSVSCRGVAGKRNPSTREMEGSTEFMDELVAEAKRILAWAGTEPDAAMAYYQSLNDATKVQLTGAYVPLETFAEQYFAGGGASTPAAVLEARRYLEAYGDVTLYDWSPQWDDKQREMILSDPDLRAAYERGKAVREREALLGDASSAPGDAVTSQVTGIYTQAATLTDAVSRLSGSDEDADAVAGIAMAMATFMADVDSLQRLAGEPGYEHLQQGAVGLYNAGADAATKVAMYQEGPDEQSLAELQASLELVGKWAESLATN